MSHYMSNNATNNKDCPPLMSDGRHATDWRPSPYVHDLILKQNKLSNSHQARAFLQNNAEALMSLNTSYFNNKNQCKSCDDFHVDPNNNDRYWKTYQKHIGYRK